MSMLCPCCLGKGTMMGRIQFTDRRKPCQMRECPCPCCEGAKFVSEIEQQQWVAKYGSAPPQPGEPHG